MVSMIVLVILFFNKSIENNTQLVNILNAPSKKLIYLSGAGIMATGVFLFYLGKDGYFLKVFKIVVDTHEVWGNPFPQLFPFFKLYDQIGYHKIFERILFYLPIGVYSLVIGII